MSETTCPYCSRPASELIRVDDALRARLEKEGGLTGVPESVCPQCISNFNKRLENVVLRENKKAAKEQSRLSLWRRRMELIREARERFAAKDYGGACVAYERYLRIVEIIYELKPNEIKVEQFNNPARAKELVLITSSYWDLVRIYDQSKRFTARFQQCCDKLAEFLPFTPIYAEMLRRVEDYRKIAKHKDAFNKILKMARKKKKRCFIATAAFEHPQAPTVLYLSRYRDEILLSSPWGRAFTSVYYQVSPTLAQVLDHSPLLRQATRQTLAYLASRIERKYHLKSKGH